MHKEEDIEIWRQAYFEIRDFNARPDDEWEQVPYAPHQIRPWCIGETCWCGNKATHKIEETTGPRNFHPLTAYVCCQCFFGACSNYPYQDMG